MTSFTVHLDDATAEALREKARIYALRPEQLLTASVKDLLGQPHADFDEALVAYSPGTRSCIGDWSFARGVGNRKP